MLQRKGKEKIDGAIDRCKQKVRRDRNNFSVDPRQKKKNEKRIEC